MIKNKILLTLLILSFCSHVNAQNYLGYTPPEASHKADAPVEQAGSDIVNVDLYTGIGSATIPIYDYTVSGLKLGVSLSYNMKGIKVDQTASSVGLGWSLNTGGGIQRIAVGLEDDICINKADPTYGSRLFYGSWVGTNNPNDIERELEYDQFILNLGGRSLEFTYELYSTDPFTDTAYIFTYPKSEISFRTVQYGDSVINNGFNDTSGMSFTAGLSYLTGSTYRTSPFYFQMAMYVIDEKGNQFFFIPGNIELKDFDLEKSDSTKRWVVQSWVLSKVKTNSGAEVKYNYDRKYVEYLTARTYKVDEYFKVPGGGSPPAIKDSFYYHNFKGYISEVSSIEYPNGTEVTFHKSDDTVSRCDLRGTYIIDSITISQEFDNNISNSYTYKFNYSYFHTPTPYNSATIATHRTPCNSIEPNAPTQESELSIISTRLKLDGITKVGSDYITSELLYSFDYHEEPLPYRVTSKTKDIYGYYNNGSIVPINISGVDKYIDVPFHTYNNNNGFTKTYGVIKTPDASQNLTYIQAGILKKITNGLGGTVEIEYIKPDAESPDCAYGTNTYKPQPFGTTTTNCDIDPDLEGVDATDGLIVSSITQKDGFLDENSIQTTYNYFSGKRFYRGGYFWTTKQVSFNTLVQKEYFNNLITPHNYFRNSNHGYDTVVVITENLNSSEQLSKTEYTFSGLMLPNQLTDFFDTSFDHTAVYDGSNQTIAGESNIMMYTGTHYHTSHARKLKYHLMGLPLSVKSFDKWGNVISKTENRYEVNYFNADSTIHTFTASTKEVFYDSINKYDYSTVLKNKHVTTITSNRIYFDAITRLKQKSVTKYSGNQELQTVSRYEYDVADNIKSILTKDSKGDYFKKEFLYAKDYELFDSTMLLNALQHVVAERTYKLDPNTLAPLNVITHSARGPRTEVLNCVYPSLMVDKFGPGTWFLDRVASVVDDTLGLYIYSEKKYVPKVRFQYIYKPTINAPTSLLTSDNHISAAVAQVGGNYNHHLYSLNRLTILSYDDWNVGSTFFYGYNVIEEHGVENDEYTSYVWDSRINEKVAVIKNAKRGSIAYTGFEGFELPSDNPHDYGNWDFDENAVEHATTIGGGGIPRSITGRYFYHLDESDPNNKLSAGLAPNTDYILTFWADMMPNVYVDTAQLTVVEKHNTNARGWKLYQVEFNSYGNPTIYIEDASTLQNVGFIDEVRLFPKGASMITYAYEPLFGVNTVCDEGNNIIYTEYDPMGRQTIVRDINEHIISKTEKSYKSANN